MRWPTRPRPAKFLDVHLPLGRPSPCHSYANAGGQRPGNGDRDLASVSWTHALRHVDLVNRRAIPQRRVAHPLVLQAARGQTVERQPIRDRIAVLPVARGPSPRPMSRTHVRPPMNTEHRKECDANILPLHLSPKVTALPLSRCQLEVDGDGLLRMVREREGIEPDRVGTETGNRSRPHQDTEVIGSGRRELDKSEIVTSILGRRSLAQHRVGWGLASRISRLGQRRRTRERLHLGPPRTTARSTLTPQGRCHHTHQNLREATRPLRRSDTTGWTSA